MWIAALVGSGLRDEERGFESDVAVVAAGTRRSVEGRGVGASGCVWSSRETEKCFGIRPGI